MSGSTEPKAPDTYAILCLVLGALAMVLFTRGGLLFAMGSLVSGVISLVRIHRDKRLAGRALAVVGLLMSLPTLVVGGELLAETGITALNAVIARFTPPERMPPPPADWNSSTPATETVQVARMTLPCGHKSVRSVSDGHGGTREFCAEGHGFGFDYGKQRWMRLDPHTGELPVEVPRPASGPSTLPCGDAYSRLDTSGNQVRMYCVKGHAFATGTDGKLQRIGGSGQR